LQWLGAALLPVAGTYLGLLLFPYPLFADRVQYENIGVYSDQPLSPAITFALE
jgi:hypothetical protein